MSWPPTCLHAFVSLGIDPSSKGTLDSWYHTRRSLGEKFHGRIQHSLNEMQSLQWPSSLSPPLKRWHPNTPASCPSIQLTLSRLLQFLQPIKWWLKKTKQNSLPLSGLFWRFRSQHGESTVNAQHGWVSRGACIIWPVIWTGQQDFPGQTWVSTTWSQQRPKLGEISNVQNPNQTNQTHSHKLKT